MGANFFVQSAMGADAKVAFDDAVSQSLYEQGHSYNGGIGGKEGLGFVIVVGDPLEYAAAEALAYSLDEDERFADKWHDPAGAIRLSDVTRNERVYQQWLFFGWSAS